MMRDPYETLETLFQTNDGTQPVGQRLRDDQSFGRLSQLAIEGREITKTTLADLRIPTENREPLARQEREKLAAKVTALQHETTQRLARRKVDILGDAPGPALGEIPWELRTSFTAAIQDLDAAVLEPLYLGSSPAHARVLEALGPQAVVRNGMAVFLPRVSEEARSKRRLSDLAPERREAWDKLLALESQFAAISNVVIRALRDESL